MSRQRFGHFVGTYTKDLKAEDLQRLFTRDARDAYRFFARQVDFGALEGLPWHKRAFHHVRLFFIAFTMRLSPARRMLYAAALIIAALGFIDLFRVHAAETTIGNVRVIWPFALVLPDGTGSLLIAFALINLLVLLEVADRLLLKTELEVARDIQQAMLPNGTYAAPGVEVFGMSRPANTVGGDFYDILPLDDGRIVVAVGDVVGKGSPAALLMALLLAILRTLIDEHMEADALMARLNVQVARHAPSNRFITLFYGVYDPASGLLTYVNAGHPPAIIMRRGGGDRLTGGGMALGIFERATYETCQTTIGPGDLLAVYSDGISEAENPAGQPFDERGLERMLSSGRDTASVAAIGEAVFRAVQSHTADTKLADDLTLLLLRRT